MATATELVDLDALERDASQKIRALQEQRERLVPDGLDPVVAQELATIRSELMAANDVLQQVGQARTEQHFQRAAEIVAAKEQAREEALGRARALDAERVRAAAAVDAAFGEAAVAWVNVLRLTREQNAELVSAGDARRVRVPGVRQGQGALATAFHLARLETDHVFGLLPPSRADGNGPMPGLAVSAASMFEERPAPPPEKPRRKTPRVKEVAIGPVGEYRQLREAFGVSAADARAQVLERADRSSNDTSLDEKFARVEREIAARSAGVEKGQQ